MKRHQRLIQGAGPIYELAALNMLAPLNRLAALALTAILAGCNFYGYESGQTYPHSGSDSGSPSAEASPSAARTYPDQNEQASNQDLDTSDLGAEADTRDEIAADEHGAYERSESVLIEDKGTPIDAANANDEQAMAGEAALDSTSATISAACPEQQPAELILAAQHTQAQQLLDSILNSSTNEQRRSCTLSTMAYIAAMPTTELYNPQQALDYQALARVNGAVRRGSLQLQLLDNTVTGMLASYKAEATAVKKDSRKDEELQRLREELSKKETALEELKRLTLEDR